MFKIALKLTSIQDIGILSKQEKKIYIRYSISIFQTIQNSNIYPLIEKIIILNLSYSKTNNSCHSKDDNNNHYEVF